MITKMNCDCGNTDVKKAIHYRGLLGYEAIVCTCCGSYSDHMGLHHKDQWAKSYLKTHGITINL